jgi:4-hydroxy-tetrahydrodipicolinate synthase
LSIKSLRQLIEGCYVTVPTPFSDTPGFPVNLEALRAYVRFLIDNGLNAGSATFLAGGAAGDFSTMTFDERVMAAETVIGEVVGRVPVAMGAQTTSTLELQRLARTAKRLGAKFIQVSCPFCFTHTEGDFEDYVRTAAESDPELGIILCNTFWTSQNLSFGMIERLAEISNVIGLKWATPRIDAMEFEDVASHFSERFTTIDKTLYFAHSAMPALGARLRSSQLQFLAGIGRQVDPRSQGWQRSGNRPHAVGRGHVLQQAVGRDREDLHQRRRLSRQAGHGRGGPSLESLPPANP